MEGREARILFLGVVITIMMHYYVFFPPNMVRFVRFSHFLFSSGCWLVHFFLCVMRFGPGYGRVLLHLGISLEFEHG